MGQLRNTYAMYPHIAETYDVTVFVTSLIHSERIIEEIYPTHSGKKARQQH